MPKDILYSRKEKNGVISVDKGHHRLQAIRGGDTMLKPATTIRKFFSTDCCNTGRFYPSISVTEIKELKDACSPMEYQELRQVVIDHLTDHEPKDDAPRGTIGD